MKILIVEDDSVSTLILRKTLQKLGYQVAAVKNGEEAWAHWKKDPVRLVISDWMMPELDGVGLCRRFREQTEHAYTYVILLTAKDRREDRLEALQAGADDFLVKPLDAGELHARLQVARRILDMQEALQQRTQEVEALRVEQELRAEQLANAMTFMEVANHRFSELFQGLPTACFTYDSEGSIHEWNRACETLYGRAAQDVFEHSLWETIYHPDYVEEGRRRIAEVFQGKRFEGIEREDLRPDGTTCHVLCNDFPLRGPDGTIVGAISANIDISERKALERQVAGQLRIAQELNVELERQRGELAEANKRLAELVTTDGLTGLKNHRHFREVLETNFAFAARRRLPISVVMLDVDKFKMYNDTYGHPAGDEVLREVANILRAKARQEDVVARYGGEEFVVLLPGTNAQGGREVAERLRKSIESRAWPLRPVTASFGVATLSVGTPTSSELIDQADKALYQSKERGRNCVTHFLDFQPPAATPANKTPAPKASAK